MATWLERGEKFYHVSADFRRILAGVAVLAWYNDRSFSFGLRAMPHPWVPPAWRGPFDTALPDSCRLAQVSASPSRLGRGLHELWFRPDEEPCSRFVTVEQTGPGQVAMLEGGGLLSAMNAQASLERRRASHVLRWLTAGLNPEEIMPASTSNASPDSSEMPLLALALLAADSATAMVLLAHGANPNRRYGALSTPVSLHAFPAIEEVPADEGALRHTVWAQTLLARGQILGVLMNHGLDPGLEDAKGDSILKRARQRMGLLPSLLTRLEQAHLSHALPLSERTRAVPRF